MSSSVDGWLSPGTNQISDSIMIAVFACGQNAYGELGQGDFLERHFPVRLKSCDNLHITDIACGNEHTSLLAENGKMYTCGYNDSGQCGLGHTEEVSYLTKVEGLDDQNIVAIHSANGSEHVTAITDSGDLYTFGLNSKGQCGQANTMPIITRPTQVESITRAGKTAVIAASSYFHTVVSTAQNELFGFGRNDFGQLGSRGEGNVHIPYRIKALTGRKVLAVACGQYHTVISLASGGVLGWGKNDYGQVGVESPEMKTDPVMVSGRLSEQVVVALAAGYYHTLALTDGGQVLSFGRNDYGQLGLGHKQNQWFPSPIPYLSEMKIQYIACGSYHSIVLNSVGHAFPFGRNNHGQLGIANTIDSTVPQMIDTFQGLSIQKVACGFYHTIFLSGEPSKPILDLSKSFSRVSKASTLAMDFRKLVNNPSRSDVSFILSGLPVYAHRCILMARCEILEKMVNGPMKESEEAQIVIPNHAYDVFVAFMEYLYTDDVLILHQDDIHPEFAFDLLTLADQFLVDDLKRICENALQKCININSVSSLLEAADNQGSTLLKRKCFNFILHHFGEVIGTQSFTTLPAPLLQRVLLAASQRGVLVQNTNLFHPHELDDGQDFM